MAKFTVCISSVIEREQGFPDYRYIAKSVIDHMGHQAVRNPEDVHTQYNFERVLNEECDFFVLIVGNTESTMVERELKIALARGIPILAFAKIHYNSQGKKLFPTKGISAIKSVSPELYNMQIATFSSCEDLASALHQELENVIDRKIKLTPIIGIDPPIAYTEGVKLIQNAKYRLIVSQRTSCLLLGPRNGVAHEQAFYSEMLNWLKTPRDHSAYFLHYFSIDKTIAEAKTNNYSLQRAKNNLQQIMSDKELSERIIFRASEDFEAISHVIGDTGLGFNFFVGGNRYYLFLPCFLTKDQELQQIIANVQSIGKAQTWQDILRMYKQLDVV